jgi:hypothetical protein
VAEGGSDRQHARQHVDQATGGARLTGMHHPRLAWLPGQVLSGLLRLLLVRVVRLDGESAAVRVQTMHSVSWTHRRMAHQGWAGTGQRGRLVDLQGMGQAHAQLDRAWDLACIACRAVLPDTDTRLEAHPSGRFRRC